MSHTDIARATSMNDDATWTRSARRCAEEDIAAVLGSLNPDRLVARVRAELNEWSFDEVDWTLLYGDGALVVDTTYARGRVEVREGDSVRSADQQLNLALVHLAAALAAGARI